MRGTPDRQLSILSSLSTEDLIPADHPIRRIRVVVDQVFGELDGAFEAMYSTKRRPSVPPEVLLKSGSPVVRVGRGDRGVVSEAAPCLGFGLSRSEQTRSGFGEESMASGVGVRDVPRAGGDRVGRVRS
jgi:hypothetical protein